MAFKLRLDLVAVLALVFFAALANAEEVEDRQGKVLSLFNVINFQNKPCRSTEKSSGGDYLNGTCYTNEECDDKNGEKMGNCAAGFGVCCVFVIDNPGDDVSQNCSYIRNPGFPSTYSGSASSIEHKVEKCTCDEEICFLRLDFETFTLTGPANTLEDAAAACTDIFQVTGNQAMPGICGENRGMHMYVPLDNGCNDDATIRFTLPAANSNNNRRWEIKVSQIECNNELKPPGGCTEFHTTTTGMIMSYNFDANTAHLSNVDQTVCIRNVKNGCCVQYTPCDVPLAHTLNDDASDMARVNTECTTDYWSAQSLTTDCTAGAVSSINRVCGVPFNIVTMQEKNAGAICDCNPDFRLRIHTDGTADQAPAQTKMSRGLCLNYKVLTC